MTVDALKTVLRGAVRPMSGHEQVDGLIDELGARISEQRFGFCVDKGDVSAAIDADRCILGCLEDSPEPDLVRLPLGDVPDCGDDDRRAAQLSRRQ